jgi:hypothetical protein
MNNLIIQASDDSPYILADFDKASVEISGKSLPENVTEFYAPLMQWLNLHARKLKNITVSFKLNYFNTASSKIILDILLLLEEIKGEGKKPRILWYYPEYDEEMHEAGIEYSEMVDLDFEALKYIPENGS